MVRIGTDRLLGISEESKGFAVYDTIGGGCLYKVDCMIRSCVSLSLVLLYKIEMKNNKNRIK